MCIVVREVCDVIVQVLLSKYLKFPENDELRRVIDGFLNV